MDALDKPDGVTPYDAVLVARDFLQRNIAELQTARADHHPAVPPGHIDTYSHVGVRVFEPGDPAEKAKGRSLIQCTEKYARIVESNPDYQVGVRIVKTSKPIREGVPIDPMQVLRSIVSIDASQARISIQSQLNDCWRRFACAKELAHIIMGIKRGVVLVDAREQLKQALKIGGADIPWNKEVSREVFAWITAIELTLPYWDRNCLHRQIDAGVDKMIIAQHFRVPKPVIDTYADTGYREKSWSLLANAKG